MEPLQRLVEQVVAKHKPAPSIADCTLLVNGKPADLSAPLRFANISGTAKLEVLTGQAPSLGVQNRVADAKRLDTHEAQQSADVAALDSKPLAVAAPDLPSSSSELRGVAHAAGQPEEEQRQADLQEGSHPLPEQFRQLGLDREIAVFTRADLEASSPNPGTEELSDDFYDFGPDDYAAVMSGYKNSHSRAEAGLKTGKLRERDRLAWAEKFPTTHVRIFMPDGHVVQAKFRTLDTVGAIKATIRSCLSEDVAAGKWYLYTTPPKQVLKADQTTLLEAKLYPAAKLHLGLEKEASRILKPGIEALRSSVPLLAGNNKAEHTLDQPVVMETSTRPQIMSSSTAKSEKSKAPKWLKLSK